MITTECTYCHALLSDHGRDAAFICLQRLSEQQLVTPAPEAQYCKCVFPAVVIPEDELPPDMPKEDYDAWYAQSWVPDGVGCRVGPVYPFPVVVEGDDANETHWSPRVDVPACSVNIEDPSLTNEAERVTCASCRLLVPRTTTLLGDDAEQQARERLAMLVQDGGYILIAQHCSDTSKDRDITGDVEALCTLRSRPVGEWTSGIEPLLYLQQLLTRVLRVADGGSALEFSDGAERLRTIRALIKAELAPPAARSQPVEEGSKS